MLIQPLLTAAALGASTIWAAGYQAGATQEPPKVAPRAPELPPEVRAIQEGSAALGRGEYFRGLDLLWAASGSPPNRNSPAFGLWWQMHASVTTVPEMRWAAGGEAGADPRRVQRLKSARATDAVRAIARAARARRIVILNEAHHSPRDRAFALQVARRLRALGYTYLAAEAFGNGGADEGESSADAMLRNGYPRIRDGSYLLDPVFGDFVRQALALGYRPIAYEQVRSATSDNSVAGREQAQAENIVEAVFRKEPGARLFIYVGYDHAAEGPRGPGGIEWMAARLKRLTGMDPLTIDQTSVSEFSDSPANRALYAAVAERVRRGPTVFLEGKSPIVVGRYEGQVDMQVVHPRTSLREQRPAWLMEMGRRPVRIPAHLLPKAGRRLVQAFIASEGKDAVPVDQVVVEAGRTPPALMLPRGRIRYAVQDPTGA